MRNEIVSWKKYSLGKHNPSVEYNSGQSDTVPDMTLSLQELVARYGIPAMLSGDANVARFNPVYTEDPELIALARMDRVDAALAAKLTKEAIGEAVDEIKKAGKASKVTPPPAPPAPLPPAGDPPSEPRSIVPPE